MKDCIPTTNHLVDKISNQNMSDQEINDDRISSTAKFNHNVENNIEQQIHDKENHILNNR
jgi:hypothetical protein